MTTEPYVPTVEVVRHAVAFPRERLGEPRPISREAFERFLATVRADALREAAIGVTTQVNNAEAAEADISIDPSPYHHGARYGMRKTAQWLHDRADRIEEEA